MGDLYGRAKAIEDAEKKAVEGDKKPKAKEEVDRSPRKPGESAVAYYKRLKKAQSTDDNN